MELWKQVSRSDDEPFSPGEDIAPGDPSMEDLSLTILEDLKDVFQKSCYQILQDTFTNLVESLAHRVKEVLAADVEPYTENESSKKVSSSCRETADKTYTRKMDYKAEFERVLQEMEWKDVVNILQEVVEQMIGDTFNPSSLTLPPPAPPAGPGFYTHPQPPQLLEGLSEGYGGCIPYQGGALPYSFKQPVMAAPEGSGGLPAAVMCQEPLYEPNAMQSGHLCSREGAYSQGQFLLYQSAVHNFPETSATTTYPAVPPHACNNAPAVGSPGAMDTILVPVKLHNGHVVYALADRVAPSSSAAPSLNTSVSKKRKRTDRQHGDEPYIKKPLNAFMLFIKEQRPNAVAELNTTDCASVNKILGRRWKMLSKEEQDKYYEEAKKERLLHTQQYPGWSNCNNYGKKRKRQRRKCSNTEASPVNLEAVKQEANKLCDKPAPTAVMNPPLSQTGVMVAVRECHLPCTYDVCFTDSLEETVSVSPPAHKQWTESSPSCRQVINSL